MTTKPKAYIMIGVDGIQMKSQFKIEGMDAIQLSRLITHLEFLKLKLMGEYENLIKKDIDMKRGNIE